MVCRVVYDMYILVFSVAYRKVVRKQNRTTIKKILKTHPRTDEFPLHINNINVNS